MIIEAQKEDLAIAAALAALLWSDHSTRSLTEE